MMEMSDQFNKFITNTKKSNIKTYGDTQWSIIF